MQRTIKEVQAAVITNLKARDLVKKMSQTDKVEFLAGAMTVLNAAYQTEEEKKTDKLAAAVPPIWVISIMSGRVDDLTKGEESPGGETVH